MQLIINADDLGASEYINNEIFELMEAGLVSSSTLMANAPAFDHAVKLIPNFPHCSFGIHLNLTVFKPLSPAEKITQILNDNNHLSSKLFTAPITSELQKSLLEELTLQVQKAKDANVPISHFDSHQHIHTIPKLFPVIKSLQRQFSVRKVRSSINILPDGEQMTSSRYLKKYIFNSAFKYFYLTKMTKGLGDFRDFYPLLKQSKIPKFSSLELMVHPGAEGIKYKNEIDQLCSDWKTYLPPNVQITNYHQL